jgi:hypothetical protein
VCPPLIRFGELVDKRQVGGTPNAALIRVERSAFIVQRLAFGLGRTVQVFVKFNLHCKKDALISDFNLNAER